MRTRFGALAFAALLTACADRPGGPAGSPTPGHSTQPVRTVTGEPATHPAVATRPLIGVTWQGEERYVTLAFTDDTVRINDGCNNELRQVSIDDQGLDIGSSVGPGSTCTGRMVDEEPPDVASFDKVTSSGHLSWQVTGDALLLTDPHGDTIRLRAAGPALSATGQDWSLDWLVDPRAYSHEGDYRAARLYIDNGIVQATDLCDQLSGSATVTDAAIGFIKMHATKDNECPDPSSSAITSIIDHVLSGTVSYEIRGDELIVNGHGDGLLIYTPTN